MSDEKYGPVERLFITVFGVIFAALMVGIVVIITFPIAMLCAWVRWLLWGWFVVPYLHIPMVPYWAILGLGILGDTFHTTEQPNGYKPTAKEHVTRVVVGILVQVILLALGYFVHHYLLH